MSEFEIGTALHTCRVSVCQQFEPAISVTCLRKRDLVLQHPGFDFSGARFEGAVPDAKSFMGGISRG